MIMTLPHNPPCTKLVIFHSALDRSWHKAPGKSGCKVTFDTCAIKLEVITIVKFTITATYLYPCQRTYSSIFSGWMRNNKRTRFFANIVMPVHILQNNCDTSMYASRIHMWEAPRCYAGNWKHLKFSNIIKAAANCQSFRDKLVLPSMSICM